MEPTEVSGGGELPATELAGGGGKSGEGRAAEGADPLLRDLPRVEVDGVSYPAVGGIALLRELGRGGMGAVFAGWHPRLECEVAVKLLPPFAGARGDELRARFSREARAAARIQSAHLVAVNDVNVEGSLHYLVMEYVRGSTATRLLEDRREGGAPGLDEGVALELGIAVAEGLAAAHAAGVIHRDVKPDNILLPADEQGVVDPARAKLADLGLAVFEGDDQQLTGAQVAMGTPGFLAPEQARDAASAGKPADVFALGATLYALLAGQPPWQGGSTFETLRRTIDDPHVPLSELRPDVSEATATLVDRCLAKAPAERPVDAAALLDALQQCAGGLDAPASQKPRATRPWRTFAVIATLACFAALGIAAFFYAPESGGAREADPDRVRGIQLLANQQPGEAARAFVAAVERGDPVAMAQLSQQRWTGVGARRDREESVALAERALAEGLVELADAGDVDAQIAHAILLQEGRGVPANPAAARQRYEQALASGAPRALAAMGVCHAYGLAGIPQDHARAAGLLEEARAAGWAPATTQLAMLLADSDAGRARELLEEAAAAGDPQAQLQLAFQTLRQDTRAALQLLRTSGNSGYCEAQFHMGQLLEQGAGGAQGIALAPDWYRLAAEQGHEGAANALARLGLR